MSHKNPETQKSPATGGLPLRGLAMVLIAVAVLLGLWGLYSLTQGGSDPTDTASESSTVNSAETAPNQAEGSATAEASPPAQAPESAAAPGGEQSPEAGAETPGGSEPAGPGEGAGESAPGGGQPQPITLNVLNNSTVPELAADVSVKLGEQGYRLGEVGNFADEIFPETTVFFEPGNAAAEGEAKELASRLGGIARERVDSLPAETAGGNELTLVLVKEVIL